MAYNLRGNGSGLRGGGSLLRRGDNVDPMANVANIADAILVMSVGLMLALIAYWSLDMSQIQEMVQQDELAEVDVNEMADEMQKQGGGYQELGTVYQDPTTGKLYMLTEDVDKGASNDKGDDANGAGKGKKKSAKRSGGGV